MYLKGHMDPEFQWLETWVATVLTIMFVGEVAIVLLLWEIHKVLKEMVKRDELDRLDSLD